MDAVDLTFDVHLFHELLRLALQDGGEQRLQLLDLIRREHFGVRRRGVRHPLIVVGSAPLPGPQYHAFRRNTDQQQLNFTKQVGFVFRAGSLVGNDTPAAQSVARFQAGTVRVIAIVESRRMTIR